MARRDRLEAVGSLVRGSPDAQSFVTAFPRSTFALGLAVALVACGTTNGDAIDAMRPDFATERARLAGLVALLPPSSAITATAFGAFSPPLVWSDASGAQDTSNAAFFTLGQLGNPDVALISTGQTWCWTRLSSDV